MSSPINQLPTEFEPKYDQPITTEDLKTLELDELTEEIKRLFNSIDKLKQSNQELETCLNDDNREEEQDEDSQEIYQEAIRENLVTIATQEERIAMIKWVVAHKLGHRTSNPHYDLLTGVTVAQATQDACIPSTPIADNEEPDQGPEGGVTL